MNGDAARTADVEVATGSRSLLPECLHDYIGEDNPVRLVDAVVGSLTGALGFCHSGAGRSPRGRRMQFS